MHGSTVCYMHGGKSLKGIASPLFKDGKRSKYMPARLQERYNESLNDPELLNLREDLAVVETRLAELLQRVDSGEAKTLWEKARKSTDDLRVAMANEDYGRVVVAADVLDRLISEGLTDYEAWNEIHQIIEQRRKLVESEQKRLVAMQQIITTEQAMSFVAAVLDIVKSSVQDRAVLNKIQVGMSELLHKPELAA